MVVRAGPWLPDSPDIPFTVFGCSLAVTCTKRGCLWFYVQEQPKAKAIVVLV